MPMDSKTFNEALQIFTEFGPERAIPRHKRLLESFPQLPSESVQELLEAFPALERAAYEIALRHRKEEITKTQAIQETERLHPMLSLDSVAKLWNQAMYFAWRDNG